MPSRTWRVSVTLALALPRLPPNSRTRTFHLSSQSPLTTTHHQCHTAHPKAQSPSSTRNYLLPRRPRQCRHQQHHCTHFYPLSKARPLKQCSWSHSLETHNSIPPHSWGCVSQTWHTRIHEPTTGFFPTTRCATKRSCVSPPLPLCPSTVQFFTHICILRLSNQQTSSPSDRRLF